MESELLRIGDLARASGLTVSALRFYDRHGVLVPTLVDPLTGYRWYGRDQVRPARLVAGLRRVGMPLAGIAAVVASAGDPVVARDLLAAHLGRLEHGLADARRELSRIESLICEESTMSVTRVTVPGPEFAAAVRAVKFAAGSDPEFPSLTGVLAEAGGDGLLRLVATDRYRLAVAEVAADVAGPPVSAIVPPRLLAGSAPDGQVALTFDGDRITVGARTGSRLDHDFPDYRRLVGAPAESGETTLTGTADELRAAVTARPARAVVREYDGADCQLAELDGGVQVNREFLLEALAAAGDGQLILALDGPIRPLAIRSDRSFSLLMPSPQGTATGTSTQR
ncbi:MAG: polymerase subunit beta [Cryptosporangiaceae bacterium]|nr:polymerase subunit beta [Cryptosporangiaceae bacterium]